MDRNGDSPLDRMHLDSYTGGDKALQREVLDLFLVQAPHYLQELQNARGDAWRTAAHRLKGAARSIGAVPLAEIAAAAEDAPEPGRRSHLDRLHAEFERLRQAIADG